MKKHIAIRILAALGGVTLCALSLCVLAETFCGVPVTRWMGNLLGAGTPLPVLAALVLAAVLCGCGVCCMMMLSAKRSGRRRGFVMQKGENGSIGVSVKSIEGLVAACVQQQDTISSAEISVVERRDGIVILLDIQETAGVNIPLAVGALQKQIRQYVGTCTGIDVQEVRVLVENSAADAAKSPYVAEALVASAATAPAEAPVSELAEVLPAEDVIQTAVLPETEVSAEEPVQTEEIPVLQEHTMAPASMPVMPEMPVLLEEEDDRPLHQRLFGAEEQPVFVPAPPELVVEQQADEPEEASDAEETPENTPGESAEEIVPVEEMAPDAVLEVVEAIALEEMQQDDRMTEAESFEYDEEVLAKEALLDGAAAETEDEIRE